MPVIRLVLALPFELTRDSSLTAGTLEQLLQENVPQLIKLLPTWPAGSGSGITRSFELPDRKVRSVSSHIGRHRYAVPRQLIKWQPLASPQLFNPHLRVSELPLLITLYLTHGKLVPIPVIRMDSKWMKKNQIKVMKKMRRRRNKISTKKEKTEEVDEKKGNN